MRTVNPSREERADLHCSIVTRLGLRTSAKSRPLDFANFREQGGAVTDDDDASGEQLTPLGELLETARGSRSKRAVSREAGISEGRWRQVVRGFQLVGGHRVPANPKRETVIAMARAVDVNVEDALVAAGMPITTRGRADRSAKWATDALVTPPGDDEPHVKLTEDKAPPEIPRSDVMERIRQMQRDLAELEELVARGINAPAEPVDGPT